jgi:hypothetical protein
MTDDKIIQQAKDNLLSRNGDPSDSRHVTPSGDHSAASSAILFCTACVNTVTSSGV